MDSINKKGRVGLEETPSGPSTREKFQYIVTRVGASASGLIANSLLTPDRHTVGSSLASLTGYGSKGGPASTSASVSGQSSSEGCSWREGPLSKPWGSESYENTTKSSWNLSSSKGYPLTEGRGSSRPQGLGPYENTSASGSATIMGCSTEQVAQHDRKAMEAFPTPPSEHVNIGVCPAPSVQSVLDDIQPYSNWRLLPKLQIAQSGPSLGPPWTKFDKDSSLRPQGTAYIPTENPFKSSFDTQADGAAVVDLLSQPAIDPADETPLIQIASPILDCGPTETQVDNSSGSPSTSASSAAVEPSSVHPCEQTRASVTALFDAEIDRFTTWLENYPAYQDDVWAPPAVRKPSVQEGEKKEKEVEEKHARAIITGKTPSVRRLAMIMRHFNHELRREPYFTMSLRMDR